MKRREFIATVAAVPLAVTAVAHAPAFWSPNIVGSLADPAIGISLRFISSFDVQAGWGNRIDYLMAMPEYRPSPRLTLDEIRSYGPASRLPA